MDTMNYMISITEVYEIIEKHARRLPPRKMPLSAARNLTLAEDIYAPMDIPAYPQSSMDGYAFAFDDWNGNRELKISGVVAAGDRQERRLVPGTAVRIFTGAAVPPGADTVVMQEKVRVENNTLIIADSVLYRGANVRPRGAEMVKGDIALPEDSGLTPPAIGFLAGIGIGEVLVYPQPAVSIIVTGSELQRPGQPLEYGQVYESNSFSLVAALEQVDIREVNVVQVEDDPEKLIAALDTALRSSDLVLLTGGVSVGDYDFVLPATEACGVRRLFYKVKQRPGKPLFLGEYGGKLVFGLPGNPSSVLTCFYMHVLPTLGVLSNQPTGMTVFKAPLARPWKKAAGLTHLLKGRLEEDGKVHPLGGQESYRMHSFSRANCLIELEEERTSYYEGALVTIFLLPTR